MSEGLGLLKKRVRTCERCGTTYETKKATSRFCSQDCLKAATGYGRNYGQYAPKAFGETRA